MNAEVDKLANEILSLSRNKLLVNLRFMDVALSYHKRVAYEGTLATDGKTLFYDPGFILRTYKDSQEEMVRTYLHMILHCVFQHPFIGISVDERLWSLACDMAVECAISDLGLNGVFSPREAKQKQIVSELKKDLKILTAEKIYSVLKRADYPDWALRQWETAFQSDDHIPWYIWEVQITLHTVKAVSESNSGDKALGGTDSVSTESGLTVEEQNTDSVASVNSQEKEFWEQVSNQIQMDLEVFSKSQGDKAGNMLQNLRSVNREKYDYTSFLKKFAVLGEAMKVNEDEFDYIYYTYGLEHYDNMPLIEPLEYKEVKRIKEFVIAIDTSGSVVGEEVQMFLQKTYNILMQEDSFFSRVNIHIIQCDAEIQEDVVITNRDEFEAYLKSMSIRGLGGTDFRPVFRYVDRLIEEKRFRNLKGMIYFTDGYGTFPKHKPPYTTAFLFVEEGYEIPKVPPWAIKLVLQHEDIIEGGVEI